MRLSRGRPCDWLPGAWWCELHRSIVPPGWLRFLVRQSREWEIARRCIVPVRPVCARRCGRPHLYNAVCSASVFWLLPCDVGYRQWPRPVRRGRGPDGGLLEEKGGPTLLDFFWSKLRDGRTSLSHLEGLRPTGRLVRDEARAFEPSNSFQCTARQTGCPRSVLCRPLCLCTSFVQSAIGIPAVDPELPAPSLGSHLGRQRLDAT